MTHRNARVSRGGLGPSLARGQVLVITLLAILLLVALVFLVINVGDQSTRRIAAQDAADSAGMAGAIQMARSMNAVSMNNISISRMLALVPVMDSLPLNVQLSLEQLDAREQAIERQLTLGLPDDQLRLGMEKGLQSLRDRVAGERKILLPLAQRFNPGQLPDGGDFMKPHTYYHAPGGLGQFWMGAGHLDQFNRSTVASAGVSAQLNANRYARDNSAQAGFVVPILPKLPAVALTWQDWHRNPGERMSILENGWIPELPFGPKPKSDPLTEPYTLAEQEALLRHIGGFVKQFDWRREAHAAVTGQTWVPGDDMQVDGGGGIGSGSVGNLGQWTGGVGGVITGFTTYGPVSWMRRTVSEFWRTRLPDARVLTRVARAGGGQTRWIYDYLIAVKLGYMFDSSKWGATDLDKFHYPRWEVDYDQAKTLAEAGTPVERTNYYEFMIVSSVDPSTDLSAVLNDKSKHNLDNPLSQSFSGWHDRSDPGPDGNKRISFAIVVPIAGKDTIIRVWPAKRWQKVGPHIWEVIFTPEELLAELKTNPQIAKIPNFVPPKPLPWLIFRDVFAGVDVGGDWVVTNPANFTAGEVQNLPVPYMLDESGGAYDVNNPDHDTDPVRREQYTFLGVARRNATPAVWPSRFASGNPGNQVVALSQVELYNPTSWDLWTQDWRAQLVPVTDLRSQDSARDWTQRMMRGESDVGSVQGAVPMDDLRQIREYLQNLLTDPGNAAYMDLMVNH